jgi:CDP-glycerol glycerophosphotransferase (TagB/SpsB family)
MLKTGAKVVWFVSGNEVNKANFNADEIVLNSIHEVVAYNSDACFIPGNIIPSFIPGVKVQVFHGLEWKKKGHFVIRECFDLYCTHGKATTQRFNELAKKHQFFDVVETGWPKLDKLFLTPPGSFFNGSKPIVLYAPTFSPSLTSAPFLFEKIKQLVLENNYNWLVKFHPKMDITWIKAYENLATENFKIIKTTNINELLQTADIMISDTSSVIGEFSLLSKPVISFNNSNPGDYLINITEKDDLPRAIEIALSPTQQLLDAIKKYALELHPYKDGHSSERIINAVEHILNNGKNCQKPLPLNLFRNLKQRLKLKYWR